MIDYYNWFQINEKRNIIDKLKQSILCRNGHDNEYNYLKYKSGKQSDISNRAVCRRCKHLQLYGIPENMMRMLQNG